MLSQHLHCRTDTFLIESFKKKTVEWREQVKWMRWFCWRDIVAWVQSWVFLSPWILLIKVVLGPNKPLTMAGYPSNRLPPLLLSISPSFIHQMCSAADQMLSVSLSSMSGRFQIPSKLAPVDTLICSKLPFPKPTACSLLNQKSIHWLLFPAPLSISLAFVVRALFRLSFHNVTH